MIQLIKLKAKAGGKMMEQINLISIACCDIPECDCGGNITIGFKKEDMPKLLKLLFNNFKIKSLLPPTTIVGITQDTDFELSQCFRCGVLLENYDDETNCSYQCARCKEKEMELQLDELEEEQANYENTCLNDVE